MKGVVAVAAMLAVLSAPAMALDLIGSLSKNKAVMNGEPTPAAASGAAARLAARLAL